MASQITCGSSASHGSSTSQGLVHEPGLLKQPKVWYNPQWSPKCLYPIIGSALMMCPWNYKKFQKVTEFIHRIFSVSQKWFGHFLKFLKNHSLSTGAICNSCLLTMSPKPQYLSPLYPAWPHKQPVDTLRTVNFTRFRLEDYHEISKRHTIQCTHLWKNPHIRNPLLRKLTRTPMGDFS